MTITTIGGNTNGNIHHDDDVIVLLSSADILQIQRSTPAHHKKE